MVTVKEKLKLTVVSFVEKYKLDGIRLTKVGRLDDAFLNEVINELRKLTLICIINNSEASIY